MGDQAISNEERKQNNLYYILNLNAGATPAEVHERYRTLSLCFHPDKQQDEQSKQVATQNFLKIQKAYQVLSDPFLREVYDQLGDEGLSIKWPEILREKPTDDLRKELSAVRGQLHQKHLRDALLPKGTLECIINATSFFSPVNQYESVFRRLTNVGIVNYSLRHDIQKRITEKTSLTFGALVKGRTQKINFLGTVRHQFSPQLSSLVTLHFSYPFLTVVETAYNDGTNSLVVKTSCAPAAPLRHIFPGLNVSLNRKLFPKRNEQGSIDFRIGQHPYVKLRLTSPSPFGFTPRNPHGEDEEALRIHGSLSGLETGITFTSYGVDMDAFDPRIVGEIGVHLTELAATIKAGIVLGVRGFNLMLSGTWSSPSKSLDINATTTLGGAGVIFALEVSHLEQRITIPVILSPQFNSILALGMTVLPTIATLTLYRFVILPRRRKQRIAHLRSARKALDNSEERRERNAVETLLKDLARKHNQTEKSRQGLVIIEATYGSMEREEGIKELTFDVTVPLQALVRNSQLYIPAGEEAKLSLQGFFDPAPFLPKTLRIRYLFRGQAHYAEIPDYLPTVLPLTEHCIRGGQA